MVHLPKVNEVEQRRHEEEVGYKELLQLVLTSTGLTRGQLRVLSAPQDFKLNHFVIADTLYRVLQVDIFGVTQYRDPRTILWLVISKETTF